MKKNFLKMTEVERLAWMAQMGLENSDEMD